MIRFNSMENYEGKMIIRKQEGEEGNIPVDSNQISTLSSRLPSTLSSSRQWRGFENPRIVRVTRAFGGKDRHSKVCTIRGIRDRRIRLSSQTASQLYDLQYKLGLNQPSKVVDWLLDVTKTEIDDLPPLQIPPGGLIPQDYSSSSMLANHTYERGHKITSSSKDDDHQEIYGGYCPSNLGIISAPATHLQGSSAHQCHLWESKCNMDSLFGTISAITSRENYGGHVSHSHNQLAPQNFSPSANQVSSMQNNIIPNFSLSQFENHSLDSQIKNDINITNNNNNSSSLLALQPSFSQNQLHISRSIPTVLPSIILPPTYPPSTNISSSMENNEQSTRLSHAIVSSSQHVPNLLFMPAKGFSLDWFYPMKTSCFNGSDNNEHQHNKKG